MSNSDDESRPARPPRAPRGPGAGAPKKGAPRGGARSSDGPKREWKPKDGDAPKREWKPREGKPADARAPKRDWKSRDGKPADARAPKREWKKDDGRPSRGQSTFDRGVDRPRHDDPEIPETVTPDQLDRIARNELKTLTAENQEFVARHLVMAAELIGSDPATALRHAQAAARRGGRIGVVRESLAITAYANEDYALALRELRTYRRITGRDDQLPMMVDSERGLGRADRALELGRSVQRDMLPVAVQVELAIAMSGARLDLGQLDRALTELEIPQLDPKTAFSWSPGLFDAYATVLEDLGRAADAERWFGYADAAVAALSDGDDDDDVIEIEELDE